MGAFISLCVWRDQLSCSCLSHLCSYGLSPGSVTQVNPFSVSCSWLGCFTTATKMKLAHVGSHLFFMYLKKKKLDYLFIYLFAFIFERHCSWSILDLPHSSNWCLVFWPAWFHRSPSFLCVLSVCLLVMPKCASFPAGSLVMSLSSLVWPLLIRWLSYPVYLPCQVPLQH